MTCDKCGGTTKKYDTVKRIVKTTGGEIKWIHVERYACMHCHHIFRKPLSETLPYKHYEKEIIFGVIEGFITSSTIGYEDYPTELTMKRWKSQKIQGVL